MTVDLMGAISQNPFTILLMINIILLVLGTFMDMSPLIIITTPIFLPVVTAFGIDPVHFGVIMILNLGIGLNTPPLGPVQFVAAAVGKITIWEAMQLDLAVLRRRPRRAPARHLRPGAVALAAVAVPLKDVAHDRPRPQTFPAVDAGNGVTRRVLAESPRADARRVRLRRQRRRARRTATRTCSRPS